MLLGWSKWAIARRHGERLSKSPRFCEGGRAIEALSAHPAGCIELGRFCGVPLRAHPLQALGGLLANWALLLLAVRLAGGDLSPATLAVVALAAAAVLQLSALAHEYGHALAARASGQRVESVVFLLFGGYAWIDLDAAEQASPRRAAAIVAAGPAVSLALGLGFWAAAAPAASWLPAAGLCCAIAAGMNGMLLAMNMLPLGPLDGGRLSRLARRWRSGTPNRIRTGDLHLERVAS